MVSMHTGYGNVADGHAFIFLYESSKKYLRSAKELTFGFCVNKKSNTEQTSREVLTSVLASGCVKKIGGGHANTS